MLDALAAEYLHRCQQYTTYFCMEAEPDGYLAPGFESDRSQRWQPVAIQHAAGMAQSWRSTYAHAVQEYLDGVAAYEDEQAPEDAPPVWKDWTTPVLKAPVIQANAHVARLEPAADTTFAYWRKVRPLERGQPLLLPVKLAPYHRQALVGKRLNTSTTLARKPDGWWLTRSSAEQVKLATPKNAPVIGSDVGIANVLTTSTGQQYGTFHGKLAERHKRAREQRRRQAKLRACLKKKGVKRLPSTRNKQLARPVRQQIHRAVNELSRDHSGCQCSYEHLNVAGLRFKARRMKAYRSASNLAHSPAHLAWGALKRGIRARKVKRASSSQACHRCHSTARENRPNQQTFCCQACGSSAQADENAAVNLASRLYDQEVAAGTDRKAIKALLARRHQEWQQNTRLVVVQPPA